ncbi:MAG TPA: GTP-binding protein [Candidatus Nanoarchaeia archaeon]|nr:GTP-binding protein [Candidatus Nanoarchaeia archaeon]
MEKIPVTIVTGALGSGKTTFVNYVLTANHGKKIGVMVNEFGSVSIDSELLVASKEKMVELPNGCMCCMVRGDIISAALQLINSNKIDYIIVETSGLAEVLPVAYTFNAPELIERAELDSILCVVDAENHEQNKKNMQVTLDQLHSADIVLLSKVDLVSKAEAEKIKSEIKKIVSRALILESVKGNVDLDAVLGVAKFDAKDHTEKTLHRHEPGMRSISCTAGPVDSDKVQEFLEHLPDNIIRAKGILCIKESEKGLEDELRISFQKVGKRTELEFTRPWEPGEKKRTVLVFIGKNLNAEELQKKLDAC